ncbi:MAG: Rab family GTPase [Candidatus Sigynarchaeota archaeon]
MVRKKIVLIGPKASGKTTFKRVFFEAANPLQLLKESLEPTRGVETNMYTAFSRAISVWDLAGQEIDHWLGDRKDVFHKASVITCMINAVEPLKDSVAFLIKLLKVRNSISPEMPVFILLSKCDLISNIESYDIILRIEKFMKEKHPEFAEECRRTKIHRVSITDAFFLKTLMTAYHIIETCIDKNEIQLPPAYIADIKAKMRILGLFRPSWVRLADIRIPPKMDPSSFQKHVEDLHNLGYLAKEHDDYYSISEKGNHFINACKKQAALVNKREIFEGVGFFIGLKSEMEKIGKTI